MSEKQTQYTSDEFMQQVAEKAKRDLKRERRLRRTIFVAGAATGVAAALGVDAAIEHYDHEPVSEIVVTLAQGQDLLGLYEEWVPPLAQEAGIDPSEIPESVKYDETLEAGQEMFDLTGDVSRQAGEQYKLELTKNDAGQYRVEMTPEVAPRIESGLPPLDADPVS
jgi:hypothetical protein